MYKPSYKQKKHIPTSKISVATDSLVPTRSLFKSLQQAVYPIKSYSSFFKKEGNYKELKTYFLQFSSKEGSQTVERGKVSFYGKVTPLDLEGYLRVIVNE